jgi:hypothetical protein
LSGTVLEVVSFLVAGLFVAVMSRYRTMQKFRIVDGPISSPGVRTTVHLQTGPYSGRKIKVDGLPTEGARLDFQSRGLIGRGVHKGHYVVDRVDAENHAASAVWKVRVR